MRLTEVYIFPAKFEAGQACLHSPSAEIGYGSQPSEDCFLTPHGFDSNFPGQLMSLRMTGAFQPVQPEDPHKQHPTALVDDSERPMWTLSLVLSVRASSLPSRALWLVRILTRCPSDDGRGCLRQLASICPESAE